MEDAPAFCVWIKGRYSGDMGDLFIWVLPPGNIKGHTNLGKTSDSVHSWQLYSAASQGDQATSRSTQIVPFNPVISSLS